MAMYRFFVPILPLVYVPLGFATHLLLSNPAVAQGRRYVVACCVTIAAALTFVHSTPLEERLYGRPWFMHGLYRGVQTERWHKERLALIGRFMKDHRANSGESVAVGAIGVLSYHADMVVHGLFGLTDPVIAHSTQTSAIGSGFPGHEKMDLLHVLSKRPTYFIFTRQLTGEPGGYPSYSPAVDAVMQRDYGLVSSWLKDSANNEEGYFTFLRRREDH